MNGYGNSVFLRTAFKVSNGAPVNTVAPAITGVAQDGNTVTCSRGTWTGTPTITYAIQWKRDNVNITLNGQMQSYKLITADVGTNITCQITATNGVGSASAISNTIIPIP
jgi:hypothetical protein